jgi:hypothetical protein
LSVGSLGWTLAPPLLYLFQFLNRLLPEVLDDRRTAAVREMMMMITIPFGQLRLQMMMMMMTILFGQHGM